MPKTDTVYERGVWEREKGTRSNIPPASAPTSVQPIASGPMPDTTKDMGKDASMSAAKMEAPLVPVQLTNEQMNSIGVKTGTVEYKQLSDEIRATGTVDVDERLQSSVQVRFFLAHDPVELRCPHSSLLHLLEGFPSLAHPPGLQLP